VVRKTEKLLNNFQERVGALRKTGADMGDFDPLEVSGIAGTHMDDTLSFDVASWLTRRMPGKVEIAWDHYDPGRELGTQPESRTLRIPACALALANSRITRTRNWKPVRSVFYHNGPLINRSEVSLAEELAKRPPQLTKLSHRQGEAVIDTIREVMLVRYRELYGTTLGDPSSVVRADLGRGVSIYLWNLPPERRLPLRAYVTDLTLKNGVPSTTLKPSASANG